MVKWLIRCLAMHQTVKMHVPFDPEILLMGTYSKKITIKVYKDE